MFFFFFFNDTATTEIYTLSPTRRSSDLVKETNQLVQKLVVDYTSDINLLKQNSIVLRIKSYTIRGFKL